MTRTGREARERAWLLVRRRRRPDARRTPGWSPEPSPARDPRAAGRPDARPHAHATAADANPGAADCDAPAADRSAAERDPRARVDADPEAAIGRLRRSVNGLTVRLANHTKGAASWTWAFGDGATSTARNPTHTYGAPRTYRITLTATSTSGVTASHSADVTVGG